MALTDLVNNIANAIDKKLRSMSVYLDLECAFFIIDQRFLAGVNFTPRGEYRVFRG